MGKAAVWQGSKLLRWKAWCGLVGCTRGLEKSAAAARRVGGEPAPASRHPPDCLGVHAALNETEEAARLLRQLGAGRGDDALRAGLPAVRGLRMQSLGGRSTGLQRAGGVADRDRAQSRRTASRAGAGTAIATHS